MIARPQLRMVLLIVSTLLCASVGASAQKQVQISRLDELKAKLEKTEEHNRSKLYSEIARELTEIANQHFTSGDLDKGQATIQEVVGYAEKASAAAKLKNKKLKDTEINLRKTARRLEEVERTLAVEDRPPVNAAVERLDAIRKELLEYLLRRG